MDIGQPKDFITGTSLYLGHIKQVQPDCLANGDNIKSPVLVVSLSIVCNIFVCFINCQNWYFVFSTQLLQSVRDAKLGRLWS